MAVSPSSFRYHFTYDAGPVVEIAFSDGSATTLRVSASTGEFISDPVLSSAIGFDRIDHSELTRDEFFVEVEAWRARHLKGQGALFDIYRRMCVLAAVADTQRRAFTEEERLEFGALAREARELFTCDHPDPVELSTQD